MRKRKFDDDSDPKDQSQHIDKRTRKTSEVIDFIRHCDDQKVLDTIAEAMRAQYSAVNSAKVRNMRVNDWVKWIHKGQMMYGQVTKTCIKNIMVWEHKADGSPVYNTKLKTNSPNIWRVTASLVEPWEKSTTTTTSDSSPLIQKEHDSSDPDDDGEDQQIDRR